VRPLSSIPLREPGARADTAIVTIFARVLAAVTKLGTRATRRPAIVAVLGGVLCAAVLLPAAPALALVTEVAGPRVGLQPRNVASVIDGPLQENAFNVVTENPLPESFANASGNPVLHASNTYAIYWDPTDHYHGDWQHVIDGFFHAVGASSGSLASVFAVDTQYTDTSNKPAYYSSTFRGAYTDTNKYPGAGCTDPHPLELGALTCLTNTQLQEELKSFIAQHSLPTGMGTIFYLLTPPGVTVCLDGGAAKYCSDYTRTAKEESEQKYESTSYFNSFCSYHSDVNPGGLAGGDANTILYAAIPWSAGGLGDGQLTPKDRTPAYECQDGGFASSGTPPEQHEATPAQQEPNKGICPSPDGFCDTGLADLIINQIGVEQQNVVTDPLLNAWQDSAHNEVTDECRNFFAPGGGANQALAGGSYYLNNAFNLAALRLPYPAVSCLNTVRLEPQFTAPNPVNAGEVVGFDGMESDISLNAAIGYSAGGAPQPNYATYTWNFGDGSPTVSGYAPGAPACSEPWLSPCAASVFHSYQYGGSYLVTLTVTDVGGHTAGVSNQITVVGPPPPSGAGAAGSTAAAGSTGASSSSSTAAAGGSSAGAAAVPNPVAAEAVVSRSLRSVLRHGLVIRYSVNEQVAGHFEVLLNRALARHLGIGGTPAAGLPAGMPAQLVIAKAIVVTTAAGRSTVTIQFSKRTASRLARLHKVTLMVRLIVRNAASRTPATTTVFSTVTLSG
jgi:PKD domain